MGHKSYVAAILFQLAAVPCLADSTSPPLNSDSPIGVQAPAVIPGDESASGVNPKFSVITTAHSKKAHKKKKRGD